MAKIDVKNLPAVRGKYIEEANLSAYTWFRVGGPADVLFMPADEEDLATFSEKHAGRNSGVHHGRRLQPSGARWWDSRGGHPAWLAIPQS